MQDDGESCTGNVEGAFKGIESLAKLLGEQKNNNLTQRNTEGATIEQYKKLNPHAFKGATDIMVAESWIMEIEKIFRVLACTEE